MKARLELHSPGGLRRRKSALWLIGACASILIMVLSSAAVFAWNSQSTDVSNYGGGDYYPSIFVNPADDKSHVVWGQVSSGGTWTITYANNTSGGFSQPRIVSDQIDAHPYGFTGKDGELFNQEGQPIGGSADFREQVRISGRGKPLHLYVVFQGYANGYGGGSPADIYFVESSDGGNTWSQAQPLNPAHPADGANRYTPALLVLPNGTVYVVYNKGNSSIVLRKRDPGSTTWSAEQTINPGFNSHPRFPNIAYTVQNNTTFLHLVAAANNGNQADDLFYTRSSNGGSNWSNAVVVSTNPSGSERNFLATDLAKNIYIVDADTNTGPIRFNHSSDNGSSWAGSTVAYGSAASFPSLAYEGNGVLDLVYQIAFDASSTVGFSQYTNGSWQSQTSPMSGVCSGKAPFISVGANKVGVVFFASNCNGNYDIYFNQQDNPNHANATSTPTNTPTITSTPTATATLDPNVTPTVTPTPTNTPEVVHVPNTDSRIQYVKAWRKVKNNKATDGNYQLCDDGTQCKPVSNVQFKVTGYSKVVWETAYANTYGKVRVWMDDKIVETVDLCQGNKNSGKPKFVTLGPYDIPQDGQKHVFSLGVGRLTTPCSGGDKRYFVVDGFDLYP